MRFVAQRKVIKVFGRRSSVCDFLRVLIEGWMFNTIQHPTSTLDIKYLPRLHMFVCTRECGIALGTLHC